MPTTERSIAAVQGLLISPAALFMGALFARNLSLPQYDLAQNAQRIVMWYSARQWTLWMLLIAMPLAVLVMGSLTLASASRGEVPRPQAGKVLVATATLMAGVILAIVILHMLAN